MILSRMKFGKIQDTSPVALGALLNSGAVQVCVLPLSVRVVTHMTSRIKLLFTRLVGEQLTFASHTGYEPRLSIRSCESPSRNFWCSCRRDI